MFKNRRNLSAIGTATLLFSPFCSQAVTRQPDLPNSNAFFTVGQSGVGIFTNVYCNDILNKSCNDTLAMGSAIASSGPMPSLTVSASTGVAAYYERADAGFQYGYSIAGPNSSVAVPVNITGYYSQVATNNISNYANVRVDVLGSYSSFSFNTYNLSGNHSGSFSGQTIVTPGYLYTVTLLAEAGARWGGSATAFIDPYLQINPTWAAANPGYSLTVSDGIGNAAPPSAVPEPATFTLFGLGLIGLVGRRYRTGRQADLTHATTV